MTRQIRVATYARCSTAHHEQNPQVQVEELKRYCDARGWLIEREIVDHGYSGSTDQRPGLKDLLLLIGKRKVDTVVVTKLDRLFRSLRHLVVTLDEWQSQGIRFVAIRDGIDYSDSPASRFFTQILGSLAEFERALAIDRTLAGLEHARRKGKRLGRPKTRDDGAILALRAKGLSYGAIARQLGITKCAVYRAVKAVSKPGANQPENSTVKSDTESGEAVRKKGGA